MIKMFWKEQSCVCNSFETFKLIQIFLKIGAKVLEFLLNQATKYSKRLLDTMRSGL